MDLPSHIRQGIKDYKQHTQKIKDFINSNGGSTNTAKDWEFAPYKVAEHLGDKGVPLSLKTVVADAISARQAVADYYGVIRMKNGRRLSEEDLNHLSFIDKLRNIRRFWFGGRSVSKSASANTNSAGCDNAVKSPVKKTAGGVDGLVPTRFKDLTEPENHKPVKTQSAAETLPVMEKSPPVATTAQAASTNAQPANAQQCVSKNSDEHTHKRPEDKKAPGIFTFLVSLQESATHIWHPFHPKPVVYSGDDSLLEAKTELRRYLLLRWPVGVWLEDSRGQYKLSRAQSFGFAWSLKSLSYQHYDRTDSDPRRFRVASVLEAQLLDMVNTPDKFDGFRREDFKAVRRTCVGWTEIFCSEAIWHLLNATVPSRRVWSVRPAGQSDVFVGNLERKARCSPRTKIGGLLEALKVRNEVVFLINGANILYKMLSEVQDLDELVARGWDKS